MKRVITACLALAMLVVTASASQAALSRNNPYRSFNSGINFGAQQWEQHHGHRTHGLLYRL